MSEKHQVPPSAKRKSRRHALHRVFPAFALALCALTTPPAAARWVLVDQGGCEGPIANLSEDHDPVPENCTPATAGKGAVCFTEICRPHCLYFNHPLEQCQPSGDLGKRYVCVPD